MGRKALRPLQIAELFAFWVTDSEKAHQAAVY